MSHAKTKEFRKLLEDELKRWADVKYTFDASTKHPRVYLEINGRTQYYVYPKTSSDHRAPLNAKSQLKRRLAAMGAKRIDA